jgi:DNA-binding transcriptional LysR family regulator
MELFQVRYFLAIYETHGISSAAWKCNVSQPSITRAMDKLEAEVGMLLERTSRKRPGRTGVLTPRGRHLLPYFYRILNASEEVSQAAREFKPPGNLTEVTLLEVMSGTGGPIKVF